MFRSRSSWKSGGVYRTKGVACFDNLLIIVFAMLCSLQSDSQSTVTASRNRLIYFVCRRAKIVYRTREEAIAVIKNYTVTSAIEVSGCVCHCLIDFLITIATINAGSTRCRERLLSPAELKLQTIEIRRKIREKLTHT